PRPPRPTPFPYTTLFRSGEPTDEWQTAAAKVKEGMAAKQFTFFAVGVEEANMEILQAISPRQPVKLKGLDFRKLFEWLSRSQRSDRKSTRLNSSHVKISY